MSVSDSQRDLISVQVFYEMMIFKGKITTSRIDGRGLRTWCPGERLPWRRLGGSSDQDERGGEQKAVGGTCVQVPLNIDYDFQGQVVWETLLGHSLSGKWTRFVFCTKCQLSFFSACSWVSAWSLLLLWCQTKPQPATGWKSQMIITLEGNSTTRSKHLCKSPQVTSSSSSSPNVCMTEGCVGKQIFICSDQ